VVFHFLKAETSLAKTPLDSRFRGALDSRFHGNDKLVINVFKLRQV